MPKFVTKIAIVFLISSCTTLFRGSMSVETVLRETETVGMALEQEAQERRLGAGPARDIASRAIPSFQWPLKQVTIHSSFGERDGRPHMGLDLKASKGTPLYAAADGAVVLASDGIYGYGNAVILRHRGGYATVYGHLYDYLVDRGDRVKRGQCIGYSGDSGRVTGPHLHFEIRDGLVPVDPLTVLRLPSRNLTNSPERSTTSTPLRAPKR